MSLVEAQDLAIPGRLHPVSLTLQAGTVTALVGPNGSGKTSLLHAIARIGRPGGKVIIAGESLDRLPPARRRQLIAFLPATRELAWPIAAQDLVALSGAEPGGVAATIGRLGLASVAHRRADQLSTGERSRVLIARALAPAPRLLLFDEPTANLDPLWQIRLMEMLREEIGGSERTALVAMHDLDAAAAYSDRLIVMDRGKVAADDNPDAVLASSVIGKVFGIRREGARWRVITPAEGQQS